MSDNYAKYRRLPVDKLTPAAARLLLAFSTIQPNESEVDVMERSGISEVLTYVEAKKQLGRHGFVIWRDGREYITMYAQEPERPVTEGYPTIPYIGVIKTTNAKQ